LLVQTFADRPVVVERDGWRVYIAVHDQAHLRSRADWKQRLAFTHPDSGGTALKFRRCKIQQEDWLQHETAWYAQYDLAPPAFGLSAWVAPRPVSTRPSRLPVQSRLWTLLQDGAARTVDELVSGLGPPPVRKNSVYVAVGRLRALGAEIVTIAAHGVTSFQLLTPDGYHPRRAYTFRHTLTERPA
jgi:hypothetical protein